MAYRVRISVRALRDLEKIYEAIHASSSKRAFSWFDGLVEAIYSLESYPDRGSVTPESKVHRELFHGKKPHVYRIIYGVDRRGKAVDVLHIRHGAMDAFDSGDLQGGQE